MKNYQVIETKVKGCEMVLVVLNGKLVASFWSINGARDYIAKH